MAAANPRMVFCYVSGVGTDSTERGRTMWARVKGRTENALLALFANAYMFRPGYIQPIGDVQVEDRLGPDVVQHSCTSLSRAASVASRDHDGQLRPRVDRGRREWLFEAHSPFRRHQRAGGVPLDEGDRNMSTDYFIGVNDAEVDRLRTQHEAWRPETDLLWHEAGFASCRSILDLGCGPGFTSMDLARVVGPSGEICAVDKAESYLRSLAERARALGVTNIRIVERRSRATPVDRGSVRWRVLSLVSCVPSGRSGRRARKHQAVAAAGRRVCRDGVPDAAKSHVLAAERGLRCERARVDRVLCPAWRRLDRWAGAASPIGVVRLPGPIGAMRGRHGRPAASVVGLVGPAD